MGAGFHHKGKESEGKKNKTLNKRVKVPEVRQKQIFTPNQRQVVRHELKKTNLRKGEKKEKGADGGMQWRPESTPSFRGRAGKGEAKSGRGYALGLQGRDRYDVGKRAGNNQGNPVRDFEGMHPWGKRAGNGLKKVPRPKLKGENREKKKRMEGLKNSKPKLGWILSRRELRELRIVLKLERGGGGNAKFGV